MSPKTLRNLFLGLVLLIVGFVQGEEAETERGRDPVNEYGHRHQHREGRITCNRG